MSDVTVLLRNIYGSKSNPLKWPELFQCDDGPEFKSDITNLPESHNVKINRFTTKYKHMYTAFVESFNKLFAEKLFMIVAAKGLQTREGSEKWVKPLILAPAPAPAIKWKIVNLKQIKHPPEDILPEDGLYHYLYLPGEKPGD